ncbi:MAG: Mov34/MPN/PAD-1 family protein [Rubrobacteraceae bacterium]
MLEDPNYIDPPGKPVGFGDLTVAKARDLVRILSPGSLPYCELLDCRRLEDPHQAEVVVFEVEVQRGQHPVHDVKGRERIAAVFREDDVVAPEALALRPDFPSVPHLNSLNVTFLEELPRSLCLYDQPYHDLKLTWTSIAFVERIREWLALTARGELHAEDQPLEPLLVGSPVPLVLPSDLFGVDDATPELLVVRGVGHEGEIRALIARHHSNGFQDGLGLNYVAVSLLGKPQEHGVIRMTPTSLRELHGFLKDAGMDLLGELRGYLESWRSSEGLMSLMGMEMVLVVALPKTRDASGAVEASDTWAFICQETAAQLSTRLGVVIGSDETELMGEDVDLVPLNVNYALSRKKAAELSDATPRFDRKIVAVGAGALGSQAFMNLVRAGCGEWTSIDPDQFLPHNLAKHELTGRDMGRPKAAALAEAANETIDDPPIATSIVADVLDPREYGAVVEEALKEADVVLDASASLAVARYLARDLDSPARRISLFFNPSGTAGVALCEDSAREIPLDWLEMRYYRELISNLDLGDHLRRPTTRVRYARSCRDLSSSLPQELVALHAAIGARAFRAALASNSACVSIWRTNEEDLSVEHLKVAPTEVVERQIGGWTVITDRSLLDRIVNTRRKKLPNETGGVLVGTYDMQRKILYAVDVLPSPPDSTEWPNLYIRGSKGLARRVKEIGEITDGQLGYLGEWHSHPRGHAPSPSNDDRKAFAWLQEHMDRDGLPAVMLIVGEGDEAWYVGQMP